MANLAPTMFREYDVRGRVNEKEINPYSVGVIARAYGAMLQRRGITQAVAGHDFRPGSKELAETAVAALRETGVDVIFIGQVLTPMMYSAQYHYQTPGGMMLTASHNPSGWLGFKLALGYSTTLGPAEIAELKQLTISEDFPTGQGSLRVEDYLPDYTRDVLSRISIRRPIRVLVNAGNGTAGPIVPAILRRAGCEVVEYLTEPDLSFPHYFPNPALEQMMAETGQQAAANGCDVGFAFDGDGDRLGVTDETGQVVWPDRYLSLLARQVLAQQPGAPVVFNFTSSRALMEDIRAHGGKPVLWKTGHSYIKEKLNELDAPLAGEMSGHIFFGKPIYYGFDDAVFAALKLVEMLSSGDKPFSALVAETPTYVATPTLQARCADEVKYGLVGQIIEGFMADGYEVTIFDNNPQQGGRIEFPDGWGVVRASSNLPVLTLRFEAVNAEKLEEIQQLFRERLNRYPEIDREWVSG